MNNTYPWWLGPPYYPPINNLPPMPNPMSCTPRELKQWLKIVQQLKKDGTEEKKKDAKEHPKGKTFTIIEVYLILLATSPFVAIVYKMLLIPALIR